MPKCEELKRVNWDYYNKFHSINEKYLPDMSEGETMATQICTAINKLVYKWYNDGDVYDNTCGLIGWLNDLSSYANWLHKYVPQSKEILNRINDADTEAKYEHLLKDLADKFLNSKTMEYYETQEKIGTIYDCDGKFRFIEAFYDDDDYEDDHEDYYEDDEDEEM